MFLPVQQVLAQERDVKMSDAGIRQYYAVVSIQESNKIYFDISIDTQLFLFMTLHDKYHVVRIQISNRHSKPLSLSAAQDTITISEESAGICYPTIFQEDIKKEGGPFPTLGVPGILDLAKKDPVLWNTLEKKTREVLVDDHRNFDRCSSIR
jgi:hypothetical protein